MLTANTQDMSTCIICQKEGQIPSVEHIVPRAMGNIHYILPKGIVCQRCNNRFSRSEHLVMNSERWLAERRKYGLISDKSTATPHQLEEHHLVKVLVIIFFEAMYHSRRSEWEKMQLEHLRGYLAEGKELDTIVYPDKSISQAKQIPRWWDRWRLRRNHISLLYRLDSSDIWFGLSYGDLHYALKINEL